MELEEQVQALEKALEQATADAFFVTVLNQQVDDKTEELERLKERMDGMMAQLEVVNNDGEEVTEQMPTSPHPACGRDYCQRLIDLANASCGA